MFTVPLPTGVIYVNRKCHVQLMSPCKFREHVLHCSASWLVTPMIPAFRHPQSHETALRVIISNAFKVAFLVCYIWYSEKGRAWVGCGLAQSPPRCTKCNSPPITGQCRLPIAVLLYDGPLLCGFNVTIKGLIEYTTADAFLLGRLPKVDLIV